MIKMELSELPAEILYNIFKYLDIESALNICEVSEYFGDIILLLNYDIEYNIDMDMRHFLNCTSYKIFGDFNFKEWVLKNFKSNYDDLEKKFIKCMEGKKVTFHDDNGMLDYKLILNCKQLIYKHPNMFSFPAELEGIDNVIITINTFNHYKNEKYDIYDLTYLRSSKNIEIIGSNKYINMSTLSCFVDNVKFLSLLNCYNLTDEYTKYFRNMKGLNINSSSITSTENFRNIKYLDLSYTKINDVSKLGNVKHLNLTGCRKIIDFTPIRNVKYLNIISCCIKDISIFSKVKKLTICECKDIIGFEYLNNVEIKRYNCHLACRNLLHFFPKN
jgi:hypothetical protein